MSNTFLKVSGYVSVTTTILNSWFLVPIKAKEIEDSATPKAGIIDTINSGVSAISLVTTYTYQYDKYIKLSNFAKWLIYGLVIVHIIAFGAILYLLVKQEGMKDKVRYGISKYLLPILYVAVSIFYIISMSVNREKVSAYRILNVINGFLNLADFAPIHESMKRQPKVYFPVHGIRALLKNAEGSALLVEIASTEEEPGTQPASA